MRKGIQPWVGSRVTPRNNQPAANTAAVITLAADDEAYHIVEKIVASYSDTPTGGKLTVTIDGTEVLDIDIVAAGPVPLDFGPDGLYDFDRTPGEEVVITLAAGGTGVTGKLFALTR